VEVKGIRALSCTAAALGLLYAAAPAIAQEMVGGLTAGAVKS
jgi:hypothetical protein